MAVVRIPTPLRQYAKGAKAVPVAGKTLAEALEHLEPALTLGRQVGDPALIGAILNHIGFTYFTDGFHEEAIRAHLEARGLLERIPDTAQLAESLHGLGENYLMQGHFADGIQWLSESASVSTQTGNRSLASENLFMVAWAQQMQGQYAEAQAVAQRSLATLEEIGDVWNLSPCLWVNTIIATCLGDFGRALEQGSRGGSLARQIGGIRFAEYNLLAMGVLHRELEDYHGAWQLDREAASLAGKVGQTWRPWVEASLALDTAGLGRLDEAQAHVKNAHRLLRETQTLLAFPQEVTYAEGQVFLARGQAAEARGAGQALAELVADTGTVHWHILALLLQGDAAMAQGEHEPALRLYRAAAEEAEVLARLPALWRALTGVAEAHRARGVEGEAQAAAARARDVIDRLAATVPDERLRAVFLQSPKVQRVVALAGA